MNRLPLFTIRFRLHSRLRKKHCSLVILYDNLCYNCSLPICGIYTLPTTPCRQCWPAPLSDVYMGVHTWGQMGSADSPLEKWIKKLTSENMQKDSFLCLCYILRAIRAGRCRERRYSDHIFIQICFRMLHFVVKFSQFCSPQAARGHWLPNQNPADVPGRILHCVGTQSGWLMRQGKGQVQLMEVQVIVH